MVPESIAVTAVSFSPVPMTDRQEGRTRSSIQLRPNNMLLAEVLERESKAVEVHQEFMKAPHHELEKVCQKRNVLHRSARHAQDDAKRGRRAEREQRLAILEVWDSPKRIAQRCVSL